MSKPAHLQLKKVIRTRTTKEINFKVKTLRSSKATKFTEKTRDKLNLYLFYNEEKKEELIKKIKDKETKEEHIDIEKRLTIRMTEKMYFNIKTLANENNITVNQIVNYAYYETAKDMDKELQNIIRKRQEDAKK